MAEFAHTVDIETTSTEFSSPTHTEKFLVRMENLDAADTCWVNIAGGAASVEGDNCVRIPPGRDYYARYRATYEGISTGAQLQLLVESAVARL